MNLDDLIERLKDLRSQLGGDTEVRSMTQQNWPFENAIDGVTTTAQMADSEPDNEVPKPTADVARLVYIV